MADDLFADLHNRHSWAHRYLLDWRGCGDVATPLRAFTTILRWYHQPDVRLRQLRFFRRWYGANNPWIPEQHERNLLELLELDVRVGPSWPQGRFGLFLASLDDGDLVTGGPTPPWMPREILKWRPGFAYVLGHWVRYFPVAPVPWPFMAWPIPADVAEGSEWISTSICAA